MFGFKLLQIKIVGLKDGVAIKDQVKIQWHCAKNRVQILNILDFGRRGFFAVVIMLVITPEIWLQLIRRLFIKNIWKLK